MMTETQPSNQTLTSLIRSHQTTLTEQVADDWAAFLHVAVQDVRPFVDVTLTHLVDALESGAAGRLAGPLTEWAIEQAKLDQFDLAGTNGGGLKPGGLLRLLNSLRRSLWELVKEDGDLETEGATTWLNELADLIAVTQIVAVEALTEAYEARQRQTLGQEQARTAQLTDLQTRLSRQVLELSSPVIQVWEEVLVLPLVGVIDAARAAQVMEDLLKGIVTHQAEIVIIDVTGVSLMDSNVVNHLMQSIKAAGLLGARSVLVGISSKVAQTMIQLGLDLKGIETRGNLQAGIQYALETLNWRIVPCARRENEVKRRLEQGAPDDVDERI